MSLLDLSTIKKIMAKWDRERELGIKDFLEEQISDDPYYTMIDPNEIRPKKRKK